VSYTYIITTRMAGSIALLKSTVAAADANHKVPYSDGDNNGQRLIFFKKNNNGHGCLLI
jgi:hypothetical protein